MSDQTSPQQLEQQLAEYRNLVDTLRTRLARERDLPKNLVELRDALMKAQDEMLDNGAMIASLAAEPYMMGIVLSVNRRLLGKDDFGVGTRVRIVDPYDIYAGYIGKVISSNLKVGPAVLVKVFGKEVWYRALPEELYIQRVELLSDSEPRNPNHFRVRMKVRVYKGENLGAIGEIEEGPDRGGDVYVRFGKGEGGYYKAGEDPNFDASNSGPQIEPLVSPGTVVVVTSSGMMHLQYPPEMNLSSGDCVLLSSKSMQIVGKSNTLPIGDTAKVEKIHSNGYVEVEIQGSTRVVSAGNIADLEEGCRVVLDASQSVILMNLGKEQVKYRFTAQTNVDWDDIGGLEEAKRALREIVEDPYERPNLLEHYKKKPAKGVLLYGPPGVGKTMLGKATASALAKIYGDGETSGFFYVKGPEILDRYVGVAEATIRALFAQAKKHKEEYGFPAVLFFDEADALLGRRGSGISSDMQTTIVPMFLTEMDGLEESGAIVILATNRPDVLDEAIVRDGRVDEKIRIDRPSEEIAAAIFGLYLRNVPLNNGYTRQELSETVAAELYSGKYPLYEVKLRSGEVRVFGIQHLTSGAMIAEIVERAKTIAMRRDKESGLLTGMRPQDLLDAVSDTVSQNRGIGHQHELADFIGEYREEVIGIDRLSQTRSN